MPHFGALDLLVNSAGITLAKFVYKSSEEEWNRVLSTNLTGAWLCTKLAIPHLRRRDGAAIVNVASNTGLVGFSNLAAYCASKGGMIQLTKAAALAAPLWESGSTRSRLATHARLQWLYLGPKRSSCF